MKNYILLYSILIALLLIGCDSTTPEPEIIPDIHSFSFSDTIDQETLTLRNEGDAPGEWRITQKPDWIEPSKSTGTIEPGTTEEVILAADLNQEVGTYDDPIVLDFDGEQISLQASLIITKAIDIFPGTGAGGIEIGDTYGSLLSSYGTPTARFGLAIDGGFLHLVTYDDKGIDFFALSGNGILIGPSPVVGMNIYAPYNGVTPERIGVESTITDLTEAYGQPDEIDRDLRSYSYLSLGISPRYDAAEQFIESILIFPSATSGKTSTEFPDLLNLHIYNEQIRK